MDNPLLKHVFKQAAMQEHAKELKKGKKFGDRPDYTPDDITELKSDEVFVFGSNLKGHHRGGAAKIAMEKFGAKWGIGKGLSGQSYAIPTSGIPLYELADYVNEFLQFALIHDDLLFYVTKIGCGNAGHTIDEIAPLFVDAKQLDNVRLPSEFLAFLNLNFDFSRGTKAPKAVKLQNYGQVRTLADLAMTLNSQNHYDNPKKLLSDLNPLIYLYRMRGTVTDDALDSFKAMLEKNADAWFHNGQFDIDQMFEHLQNEADNDALSAIDLIYSRRANAKIARVVMLMNEIARYTNPKDLISDIHLALLENGANQNGCHPIFWNDSFHYPFYFFEGGIEHLWDSIIDNDGYLDNDKLQKVMFDNHEQSVHTDGLPEVIRNDYDDDGPCLPEVFFPKENGTGPIYVQFGETTFVKSCGEGKGPRQWPELYEMQFLTPILKRLCTGENPEYIYTGVYLPIRDYSRPVYHSSGKVYFENEKDKKLYLMGRLKEYKANQKNNEQS